MCPTAFDRGRNPPTPLRRFTLTGVIKVYAVALALGVALLIAVVIRTTLSDKALEGRARMALGALLGFGMGGMAAEYSPLDISWPVALAAAVVAAVASVAWVRFATRREG